MKNISFLVRLLKGQSDLKDKVVSKAPAKKPDGGVIGKTGACMKDSVSSSKTSAV